jgi:hypothetical protein
LIDTCQTQTFEAIGGTLDRLRLRIAGKAPDPKPAFAADHPDERSA